MNACIMPVLFYNRFVLNTFRCRLYPIRKKEALLNQPFEECRWLTNHFPELRKNAWESYGVSLSHYGQQNILPALKKEQTSLDTVDCQPLQNVAVRINLTFQAFFRRVKTGEDSDYPRFRGKGDYSQIAEPQWNSGCELMGNGHRLSKLGVVPIVLDSSRLRQDQDLPHSQIFQREDWVTISREILREEILLSNPLSVGIDVGINAFASLSDGTEIGNQEVP